MLKLIHTADIHFSAKMDSRFPKDVADQRKADFRTAFQKMVEFADNEHVRAILLSGDVFDSDHPFKKDKEFFYSVLASYPHIDFLYLRGNHDKDGVDRPMSNLKTFSSEWTTYDYGEVTVSGIELDDSNASSLYSTLDLDKDKCNIVMLHGQVGSVENKDTIHLVKLKNKYIDYLALGHVHKPQRETLDERGTYVYSGCLTGHGFDETGPHGFSVISIEDGKLTYTLKASSAPIIEEKEIDVTSLKGTYDIYRKIIDSVVFKKTNIYRICLVGETEAELDDLEKDLVGMLSSECAFVSVKDQTKKITDISKYEKDLSLKGEFVRGVFALDLSDEEKTEIVTCGLKALSGEVE